MFQSTRLGKIFSLSKLLNILSDLGSQLFQHKENEKEGKTKENFTALHQQEKRQNKRGQNWTSKGMKSNTVSIQHIHCYYSYLVSILAGIIKIETSKNYNVLKSSWIKTKMQMTERILTPFTRL